MLHFPLQPARCFRVSERKRKKEGGIKGGGKRDGGRKRARNGKGHYKNKEKKKFKK